MAILIFFPIIFPRKTGINSEWSKMAILNFSQKFSPKKTGINSQKCTFQIYSNLFGTKRLEEIWNGQN